MSNYYRIVNVEGRESIAFGYNGNAVSVDESHSEYAHIRASLLNNDYKEAYESYNLAFKVASQFEDLTERVSLRGNSLFFDREPIEGPVVDTILKFRSEGHDFKHLVNFLEKLYVNNNEVVREHLFRWVADRGLTITPEGDILGYKGVYKVNDGYTSTASGQAIVNGEVKTGRIPQKIGDVVEMPRNEVTFDPNVTCSTGLHVGSWEYATGYGNTLVRVIVNPRDVISVPVDYAGQKMRVCRYRLDAEASSKVESSLYEPKTKAAEKEEVVTKLVTKSASRNLWHAVYVSNVDGVLYCTCEAWKYRKDCRHARSANVRTMPTMQSITRKEFDAMLEGDKPKTESPSRKLKVGDVVESRRGVKYTIKAIGLVGGYVLVNNKTGKSLNVLRDNMPKSFKVTRDRL